MSNVSLAHVLHVTFVTYHLAVCSCSEPTVHETQIDVNCSLRHLMVGGWNGMQCTYSVCPVLHYPVVSGPVGCHSRYLRRLLVQYDYCVLCYCCRKQLAVFVGCSVIPAHSNLVTGWHSHDTVLTVPHLSIRLPGLAFICYGDSQYSYLTSLAILTSVHTNHRPSSSQSITCCFAN